MAVRLSLKPKEYERIDKLVGLKDGEYYAVVASRLRGTMVRSIHVFARQPMTKELTEYENTAGKMKFRRQNAEIEGSALLAAKHLYNALIARAYDVPVGWQIHGEIKVDDKGEPEDGYPVKGYLDREQAKTIVPDLIKRSAIRDAVEQHFSEAQMSEMDDTQTEVKGQMDED